MSGHIYKFKCEEKENKVRHTYFVNLSEKRKKIREADILQGTDFTAHKPHLPHAYICT